MTSILSWSTGFALVCLTIAVGMALARMLMGPRAEDRIIAFDCLYVSTMLAVLTLGIVYRSSSYFEAALLIALFGFVGTCAMAKFLLRGEIIE